MANGCFGSIVGALVADFGEEERLAGLRRHACEVTDQRLVARDCKGGWIARRRRPAGNQIGKRRIRSIRERGIAVDAQIIELAPKAHLRREISGSCREPVLSLPRRNFGVPIGRIGQFPRKDRAHGRDDVGPIGQVSWAGELIQFRSDTQLAAPFACAIWATPTIIVL